MDWGKYVLVAATSASPVGEEFVSIPLGIALGLSAPLVALVAVMFNYLPTVIIVLFFQRMEGSPRAMRWLSRLRSDRVRRVLDRYGFWGVVAVTPWPGVYATTITLELLGMSRGRILRYVLFSLCIYAAGLALLSWLGRALLT